MLKLKLWRLQNKLTQESAAKLLEIGESTLAYLESGRMRPSKAQIAHLRRIFKGATDRLFTDVEERVEVVL